MQSAYQTPALCELLRLLFESKVTKLALHIFENDIVAQAYALSTGKWWGCNWPTNFGPMQLQLENVWARQAMLLAEATSGKESEAWYAAGKYLTLVEADAALAENLALIAIEMIANQRWEDALTFSEAAVALESKYRSGQTWKPLRDAIAAELAKLPPEVQKTVLSRQSRG